MQIYSDKVFKNPVKIIEADSKSQMAEAFEMLEKYSSNNYILGYISYDFEHLYFEVYDSYEKFIPKKNNKNYGIISKSLVSKEEYFDKIERIKNYISEGVTYEVNYTYPNEVRTNLSDLELYEKLLEKQTTPYNMFFKTSKKTILSFSPELFFRLKGNKIFTKPMKGTVQRGKTLLEDKENELFLYNDVKNRAENVMIVDLLRNDLGRIAKTGTVNVDKLFDIEKHSTLFQMTSEISAELEDNITLYDIFNAIFPCGSITGAPKISTMRVIDEVEPYNREVYCGAIGFFSPEEIVFSVPIRILQANGGKVKSDKFVYNVGGAVVWDSTAQDEWDETLTKMKFLNTDFYLIETFNSDYEKHIKRIKNSAKDLNFIWNNDIEKIRFIEGQVYRLILYKNGNFEINNIRIAERPNFNIKISGSVDSSNPFLYHKTSIRNQMPTDVFDEIRVNEKKEITEGTFTNIAVKSGDKLFTPPVNCGLLNGVLRQKLVESGELIEKILYPKDLYNAEKVYCLNSIRGVCEVELY